MSFPLSGFTMLLLFECLLQLPPESVVTFPEFSDFSLALLELCSNLLICQLFIQLPQPAVSLLYRALLFFHLACELLVLFLTIP